MGSPLGTYAARHGTGSWNFIPPVAPSSSLLYLLELEEEQAPNNTTYIMKLFAASALVGTAMAGTICAGNFGIPTLFNCRNRNSEKYFKQCLWNKVEGEAEKDADDRNYDTFHLVDVKQG